MNIERLTDEEKRRRRQADAQRRWNDALAFWIPVAPDHSGRRENHDPGDEDRG